ncbi:hypothetical protein [Egicoccus sp. AB-alg2]|uniref:hypothetical protein n=1 Tax=Egicoccus sp. AB-alg2 TaxID=3242693 RepID=UPI00359DBF2D
MQPAEADMPVLVTLFRVASWLRGARAFHPHGLVYAARWEPTAAAADELPGSSLAAGHRPARLRISHGIGLPATLPDVLGLAVKVLDVHGPGRDQDLLLASGGRGRIGRHLLRLARDVAGGAFTSLLPYRLPGGTRRPVLARALDGSAPVTYAALASGRVARPPDFEVRLGTADGVVLGVLRAGPPTRPTHADSAAPTASPGPAAVPVVPGDDEHLDFDPWHTGPELRPVGWLNRLRRPTYGASRAGRASRTTSRRAR